MIPVVISLNKYIKDIKLAKITSIAITLMLFILLIIVFFLLSNIKSNIDEIEIPVVFALDEVLPSIKSIYGLIILISIYTTATSLGISYLKNTSKSGKSYNIISIIICTTSVLFSNIGFSNLVNLLYPILGGLGIFQIIQILYANILQK